MEVTARALANLGPVTAISSANTLLTGAHNNIVSANILAAISKKKFSGDCYNIACRQFVSNNEILDAMKDRFGDRVKVKHAPERPGDVKHTLASWEKAKKDFGYEPLVHFWEGLERTYSWWGLND